jgi:hypothetical protein
MPNGPARPFTVAAIHTRGSKLWRISKRSGLIKKRLPVQWVKMKKSGFHFELYGSSFAAENKGHWRWAIFSGREKKPVQVGSFRGPLADATQHAQAAVSRLKGRAKKRAPLHTN